MSASTTETLGWDDGEVADLAGRFARVYAASWPTRDGEARSALIDSFVLEVLLETSGVEFPFGAGHVADLRSRLAIGLDLHHGMPSLLSLVTRGDPGERGSDPSPRAAGVPAALARPARVAPVDPDAGRDASDAEPWAPEPLVWQELDRQRVLDLHPETLAIWIFSQAPNVTSRQLRAMVDVLRQGGSARVGVGKDRINHSTASSLVRRGYLKFASGPADLPEIRVAVLSERSLRVVVQAWNQQSGRASPIGGEVERPSASEVPAAVRAAAIAAVEGVGELEWTPEAHEERRCESSDYVDGWNDARDAAREAIASLWPAPAPSGRVGRVGQ